MGSSPSPPPPPDYAASAREQGAENKQAAIYSSRLNNPNVEGPYGSQTYTESDLEGGRPTLRQTLSPAQQQVLASGDATKIALSNLANQGATAASGVLGTPLNYDAASARASHDLLSNTPGMRSTDFTANASAMPGSAAAVRDQMFQAAMSRVNEDTGIKRDDKRSELIANGLRPGTAAYDNAMFQIDRGYNDARQQAILGSGLEAQRQSQMDLAARQQGVSEQAQMFGAGTTAQQQAINQQLQQFNLSSEARRQQIAETLALRQAPLNEINALQSGSQIVNPFATPGYSQNSTIAAAPVFQAAQLQAQDAMDRYNAKAASADALQSGLFSLGGSGMSAGAMAYASDRRAKRQIVRIGTHCSGIGVYRFRYNRRWSSAYRPGVHVGLMAAEVLTVDPTSVIQHPDGYLMVNYGRFHTRFQEKDGHHGL